MIIIYQNGIEKHRYTSIARARKYFKQFPVDWAEAILVSAVFDTPVTIGNHDDLYELAISNDYLHYPEEIVAVRERTDGS